jgi:hypothetical protein
MGIEKYSKYKGPQQNCNIEFECENGDIPKILTKVCCANTKFFTSPMVHAHSIYIFQYDSLHPGK